MLITIGMLVVGTLAWRDMFTAEGAAAVSGTGPAASAVAHGTVAAFAASAASSVVPDALRPSLPAAAGIDDIEIPPEGLEACGVRRVSADELRRWRADLALGRAQLKPIDEQMQRVGNAAVARIAARLAAGDERQQVAARLLMRDREGAAQLAERSSDARAYQMALSACSWGQSGEPTCARLNARRWAELDPSDARPWLRLMAAALQRKDMPAVDAALAEAAARPRLSRGSGLLEAQAVAVAGAVPDTAVLAQALVAVIGIDATLQPYDIFIVSKLCKDDGLRDPNRLAQCRAVARQVLAGTVDLAEATAAQRMADRAGVPPAQQAYSGATLKAASEKFSQDAQSAVGFDCASMSRLSDFSAQRAAQGDLGLALSLLPAQPGR